MAKLARTMRGELEVIDIADNFVKEFVRIGWVAYHGTTEPIQAVEAKAPIIQQPVIEAIIEPPVFTEDPVIETPLIETPPKHKGVRGNKKTI